MVERLIAAREEAGYSIAQLALKVGASRAFLTAIEAGRKNFTVDQYDKFIEGCNSNFEDAICGKSPDSFRARIVRDLFRLLKLIGDSQDEKVITGVKAHLELAAHSVLTRTRGSPRLLGEGEDRTEGAGTGSPAHKPQPKNSKKPA